MAMILGMPEQGLWPELFFTCMLSFGVAILKKIIFKTKRTYDRTGAGRKNLRDSVPSNTRTLAKQ